MWEVNRCLGASATTLALSNERGTLQVHGLLWLQGNARLASALGTHLSFISDVFGVRLETFRRIHRSCGLMAAGHIFPTE